jgi:hypothetical protein
MPFQYINDVAGSLLRDGAMGKWANGQMGKWANGQMGKENVAAYGTASSLPPVSSPTTPLSLSLRDTKQSLAFLIPTPLRG